MAVPRGCILCKYSSPTYTETKGRMEVLCKKQDRLLPEVFAGCTHFAQSNLRSGVPVEAYILRAAKRATDEEWNKDSEVG